MEEARRLTCIVCPIGCSIRVYIEDGKVKSAEGHNCRRGLEYVKYEVSNPTRILTTTVRVEGGHIPMVSVKTAQPIPKGMIFNCMKVINQVKLKAPVNIGDTVVKNILNTGVDVVATKNIPRIKSRRQNFTLQ